MMFACNTKLILIISIIFSKIPVRIYRADLNDRVGMVFVKLKKGETRGWGTVLLDVLPFHPRYPFVGLLGK